MATSDTETVSTSIAGGAVGFGLVAIAAPRLLTAVYGLPGTGPFRFLLRLWGTRTAAIGAMMMTEKDAGRRRRWAAAATAVNAVDALMALRAGPDVTRRSRWMVALTSGGFAAAGAAVLAGVRD